MPIDFLKLRQNSNLSVMSFVQDKFLFRMRLVSKIIKQMVDESMLITRNNYVQHLTIRQRISKEMEGTIRIHFVFDGMRDYAMWEIKINHIRAKVKVLEKQDYHGASLSTLMNLTNAQLFLEHLKSAVQRTQFDVGAILCEDPSIVRVCSHTFAGRTLSITRVELDFRQTDFAPWMKLLKSVKTEHVTCTIHEDTNELRKFVVKLADVIHEMHICFMIKESESIDKLAIDILRRKCEVLRFNVRSTLTLKQADNLLKHFHQSSKKVHFEAWTSAEPLNVQIGKYKLIIRGADPVRPISIKHI